ncbi:MAG: hypothetical protein KAG89_10535 [Fulvimarina manganoxydans]|uniref:hypothetical protein n=1 Tax=Fulvimarina manganoxydans TaxID=937218 RepID=UPI0023565417|nr:hypothetical protein [Fulvimarina manganoxydans]MCK5932593.1 hypothetical protein [Fulvimarina manganoxydans]
MPSTRFPIRSLVALSIMSALAGCASEPTFGERLVAEGQSRAEMGAQAVQAEKDIARGRQLIEEGRSQERDARAKLDEGQRLVDRGNDRLNEIRNAVSQRR